VKAADVVVVGAGAAGLATAIFVARRQPSLSVVAMDGARVLGAKILVSGGGRCNVTNAVVTEADFSGGSRTLVRRALRAFSAQDAARFFREIGVSMHEEEHGKLFPDSMKARTVLDALLGEARRLGVRLLTGHRAVGVARSGAGFEVETPHGTWAARRVVLATGGLSLPKTGSDGVGYAIARRLGHSLVPTTPALVPLVLDGSFHAALSGVSLPAAIVTRSPEKKPITMTGSLLWTHFGVSGPVALDASRHWLRARVEGLDCALSLNVLPGWTFDAAEAWLVGRARSRPRASVATVLGEKLPVTFASAVVGAVGLDPTVSLSQLRREDRRRLTRRLLEWPLPVRDSRGYGFAEVTAGGVPSSEVSPATLESRLCPGLHLVGEILDVDGRIGGFNFQWAWSSAFVAAGGITG